MMLYTNPSTVRFIIFAFACIVIAALAFTFLMVVMMLIAVIKHFQNRK